MLDESFKYCPNNKDVYAAAINAGLMDKDTYKTADYFLLTDKLEEPIKKYIENHKDNPLALILPITVLVKNGNIKNFNSWFISFCFGNICSANCDENTVISWVSQYITEDRNVIVNLTADEIRNKVSAIISKEKLMQQQYSKLYDAVCSECGIKNIIDDVVNMAVYLAVKNLLKLQTKYKHEIDAEIEKEKELKEEAEKFEKKQKRVKIFIIIAALIFAIVIIIANIISYTIIYPYKQFENVVETNYSSSGSTFVDPTTNCTIERISTASCSDENAYIISKMVYYLTKEIETVNNNGDEVDAVDDAGKKRIYYFEIKDQDSIDEFTLYHKGLEQCYKEIELQRSHQSNDTQLDTQLGNMSRALDNYLNCIHIDSDEITISKSVARNWEMTDNDVSYIEMLRDTIKIIEG